MINKEEKETREVIDNLIAIFKHSIFETVEIYSPDNYKKALENVKNLIKKQDNRIKELEEINSEHQKLNGELQKKLTYYEEICKRKTIQEPGMSNLYKEKKDVKN